MSQSNDDYNPFRDWEPRPSQTSNPNLATRPVGKRFPIIAIGLAGVVVIAGLIGAGIFLKSTQKLYVVNGSDVVLEVSIDDEDISVNPHDHRVVKCGEGTHTVKQRGGEPFEIEMKGSALSRFTGSTAFVVDPTRTAILYDETVTYSAAANTPAEYSFIVGERFTVKNGLDHVFEEPPAELRLDSENATARRRVLNQATYGPFDIIWLDGVSWQKKCEVLERRLSLAPWNEDILVGYSYCAAAGDELPRALAVFEKRLDARPLEVAWHRHYQGVAKRIPGALEAAVGYYDKALARDSDDSMLQHLRGRLEPTASSANAYHQKALDLDSQNEWAVRALANNFLSAGDFHRAWNLVSAPNGSSPALDDFSVQLLFANRRHGELIGARPFVPDEVHFAGHSWKMAAHALARENGAVADQFVAFVDEQARFLADAAAVSLTAEMVAERRDLAMFRDYLNRDFKSIATQIENDPNESDNFWNAVVELEQGRVAAADAAFGDNLDLRGADMLLALSAAWRSEGSVDDAQRRKSEWIEFSLTNALSPNGRIAQLLKRESQPSVDDIRDTLIKPAVKRLVALLVASELPPAEREPYLQLAERYNFYPSAPHFFVVQLAEKLRGESR